MEPHPVGVQFSEVRARGQGSEVPSSAERLGEEGGQVGSRRRVARTVGFGKVRVQGQDRGEGWARDVPS